MTLFNLRQRKLITRLLSRQNGSCPHGLDFFFGFDFWKGFYPFQKWSWWTLRCQAAVPLNRSPDQLADFLDDSPWCPWFILLPGGNLVTDNICTRIPPTVMVIWSYHHSLCLLKSNVLIQVQSMHFVQIMAKRLSHLTDVNLFLL